MILTNRRSARDHVTDKYFKTNSLQYIGSIIINSVYIGLPFVIGTNNSSCNQNPAVLLQSLLTIGIDKVPNIYLYGKYVVFLNTSRIVQILFLANK